MYPPRRRGPFRCETQSCLPFAASTRFEDRQSSRRQILQAGRHARCPCCSVKTTSSSRALVILVLLAACIPSASSPPQFIIQFPSSCSCCSSLSLKTPQGKIPSVSVPVGPTRVSCHKKDTFTSEGSVEFLVYSLARVCKRNGLHLASGFYEAMPLFTCVLTSSTCPTPTSQISGNLATLRGG